MDPYLFDGLIRKVSRRLSRRTLVGGSLGAAVLAAVGLDQAATAKPRNKQRGGGSGVSAEHCLAIGQRCDPKQEIREGKRNKKKAHTCEGIEKRDKKTGEKKVVRGCCTRYSVPDGAIRRCACVPNGEPCTAETARQCCSQVCTGGVCGDAPVCPEEGQTCATAPGTACCPDADPDVVCAGGLNPNKICQDCSRPPTAEGAYCKTPPGNQCCGDNPTCFVGIRLDNGQPDCFTNTPTGLSTCHACTASSGCPPVGTPSATVCVRDVDNVCGCAVTGNTFCATPCP